MRLAFPKRGAIVLALATLILFLVRPGAEHLRGRISRSIGQAIGEQVGIGSVHLRFLPRPGFELQDFIIRDEPAFGSEPLLRSPDVTACLRLSSMLRGRLEISNLSLADASLNLARDAEGKWNVREMLEHTNRSLTGPTAAKQTRPAFPYIEATGARINFKAGVEKTHFALTDARFGLWQESENTWGMRMEARPLRTDANLTDIGQITVEGAWQRAPSLRDTPVRLSFEWKRAQAGQLSKLLYGQDKGWRGEVLVSGSMTGTPEGLELAVDGSVDDFRRFDVLGGGNLRLAAHCTASYDSVRTVLANVDCSAPSGDGSIEVKGSASGPWLSSRNVSVIAAKVPLQHLIYLARHTRGNLPENLEASGEVNGMLTWARDRTSAQELNVDGEVQNLQLMSTESKTIVMVERVPFSTPKAETAQQIDPANSLRLGIGPARLSLGRPVPLEVRAMVSRAGYEIAVRGDARISKLQELARSLSIPVPNVSAEGAASVDVTLAGTWSGNQPAHPLGKMQLHSVYAQVRGLNVPIVINSAALSLEQDYVRVQNLSASAAHTAWHGSMKIPRPCTPASQCRIEMSLRTPELSATALNELVNPSARRDAWYKLLTTRKSLPYLLQARGDGKVTIDKLVLGKTVCAHFTSDISLDSGQLILSHVSGNVLGGKVTGEYKGKFLSDPPAFSGTGTLEAISLASLAELMHDGWISGEGTATYEFEAAGSHLPEVIRSAEVRADFTIVNGQFPHVALASSAETLHAHDFSGQLLLHAGNFSLEDATLNTVGGVYSVSGTASLDGALNFKMLSEGKSGFTVTGTLLKTRVSPIPVPPTQAALRP